MQIDKDSVLPVCAVRYALRRQTYMPGMVAEEIKSLLPEISDRNLTVMARDLNNYLRHEPEFYGMQDIEISWNELYTAIVQEYERRAGK